MSELGRAVIEAASSIASPTTQLSCQQSAELIEIVFLIRCSNATETSFLNVLTVLQFTRFAVIELR